MTTKPNLSGIEVTQDEIVLKCRRYSVTIENSYKIKSIKKIKQVLEICDWQLEKFTDFRVNKFKNVVEWKAHNLLYFLNIKRDHTQSVDYTVKEKWYRKLGYWLLFPISFWIGV